MRARTTLIATSSVVLALAGCKDLGLEDRNLPHEEAAHRAPDALVQAVHPETRATDAADAPAAGDAAHADDMGGAGLVTIGEQTFQASGMPLRAGATSLRPVGSAGGGTFSAAAGDEAPYDRLYLAHGADMYVTYLPMRDAGDPVARNRAQQHTLEDGGAGH